jgi:hypothetical protein
LPATNATTLMIILMTVVTTSVLAFSRRPRYGSRRTPYKGW